MVADDLPGIYEELKRRARTCLQHVYDEWSRLGRLRPIAIAWPGDGVRDDDGRPITNGVVCLLPESTASHDRVIKRMVARSNAIAVLVMRQEEDRVKAVFESAAGTITWTMRIEDRVNYRLVSREQEEARGVDRLGVLWLPN